MKRPSYVGSVNHDRPRTVYFYATSHCNSNCSYCVFKTSNLEMPRMHMPLNTIKRVWLESDILRTCGIVVQGGEFTIHPEAEGIMHFFHMFLPKVTLLTNAVEPELAKPLIPYATQVTISLDGPMHDVSRGVKNNLDNVISLLKYLKEVDKSTTIQITLGPWNARNVAIAQTTVKWFLDTCVEMNAQPRFNIASDDGLLGIAHYEQKWEILKELYLDMMSWSGRIEYDKIAKSIRGGAQYILAAISKSTGTVWPCYSTSIYSTIGADGTIWMCQGLSEKEASIGKVGGDYTFDQIWATGAAKRQEYRVCQACSLSCQLNGDIAYLNSKQA